MTSVYISYNLSFPQPLGILTSLPQDNGRCEDGRSKKKSRKKKEYWRMRLLTSRSSPMRFFEDENLTGHGRIRRRDFSGTDEVS
ncbi:hypothetical protein NPIL_387501 [Nephila pilipes]|uniref:Uncharacterized protein n=1 Tax=Nephila pilipes TaxID=299642 RepID=A0A8X6N3N2_NEPPI|nr:hypothetical protein NPIL_387501 [Nephila pilipes]